MLRNLIGLAVGFILIFTHNVSAQSIVGYADPSQPKYWADTVGFWINAEQLCGVQYDPAKREALTAQFAAQAGVSVTEIKRMAAEQAKMAAPHFTDLSCQNAHNEARRLELYAPGAPTRPYAKVTVSNMLEESAATQPVNTATSRYTLQIDNPRGVQIIRVWVVGGKVEGEVCGTKTSCSKTVTLPKGRCGGEVRLQLNASMATIGANWCQSGGTVEVSLKR